MIFGEWGSDISILIALVLALWTVYRDIVSNKKYKESLNPVFVIEKIKEFPHSFYVLFRNVNDNYFVIKNVHSNTENANAEYLGVMNIETKSEDLTYTGHCIEVKVKSPDEINAEFEIEGVSVLGKKFKVKTPIIKFKNYRKKTLSIQGRYLEFTKK